MSLHAKRVDLDRFYQLIDQLKDGLGQPRLYGDWSEDWVWPERGIYLLLEYTERRDDDHSKLRITRVGTHAIKEEKKPSTLQERLLKHSGIPGEGDNHRRSVVRRHIGRAIMCKSNGTIAVPTWVSAGA